MNQKGLNVCFLPAPYNWKTYGAMNQMFWEKHQETALEEALMLVKHSHLEVMDSIRFFSDEALFTKGYYKWTGGSTIGSYYASSTSSHYMWAYKVLSLHLKSKL